MLQKQKVKLTPLLQSKIKDLRKTYNIRGDILSKELDRGASYISQLENGKIQDIEFDFLDSIFQRITGLFQDNYNNFIRNYIINIISTTSSKELLYNEEWIHIYVMQNFQYPISERIIHIIKDKLSHLNCSPEKVVKELNRNRFQNKWSSSEREKNKLYVTIDDENYDNYYVYTDITYSLPEDYLSKILTGSLTTISYIFLDGILKTLYYMETEDLSGSIKKTKKILFDNNYFDTIEIFENVHNLSHSQPPLNIESSVDDNSFTFYDDVIVNYNEKYAQLEKQAFEKLDYAFKCYKEEHSSYACEALEKIINNMNDDIGLIMAIISSPINTLPRNRRSDFWDAFKELLKKYSR